MGRRKSPGPGDDVCPRTSARTTRLIDAKTAENNTHVGQATGPDPNLGMPDSPRSSSVTISEGTPHSNHETLEDSPPGTVDVSALNAILDQREGQLDDRTLAHLSTHHTAPVRPRGHGATNHRQPIIEAEQQGSELGEGIAEMDGMYAPVFSHLGESASASATMESVELLFPGVERVTLAQIIENRFKPGNIYRLLASEKDHAESQRVISIGGVSFEQGEREGKESEYRMALFFKGWAAYCGILTKLAPMGLQGDLVCARAFTQ